MRRRHLPLALAALIVMTAQPAAAVEPNVEPIPAPATTPGPTPTSDPALGPTPRPDPTPGPTDPTPGPTDTTPGPTDPTPGPTAGVPDPAATPAAVGPAGPATPSVAPSGAPPAARGPARRFIVVLDDRRSVAGTVGRFDRALRVKASRSFGHALRGFAAELTTEQLAAIAADPSVDAVVLDEPISIEAQSTPTGVLRVYAKFSSVARINGADERVDADVAVIDTGIAPHPDLNVAGGYDCSTSNRALWRDVQGHGTHVAGTIGALDNGSGVVGVAPGARLWAVKILDDQGSGYLSWYVCGLDWVAAQRDTADPDRPLFEAVNMSVGKSGSDDRNCGRSNNDVLHRAICRVVGAGIPVVAAAGNYQKNASTLVPAAYDEAITVSALADTDGKAGGLGGNRCWSWGGYDRDDTFADFSNYGADVDLIAPGKCIWSTKPGNAYGYSSGTSMATPHVTGAVALYRASRPAATPAEVREALQYLGNLGWDTRTDPDSLHERLLDARRIGPQGDFSLTGPSFTPSLNEAGGTLQLPIGVNRSATFFEGVSLSLGGVPTGITASFSTARPYGFSPTATTLTVVVPRSFAAGRYTLRVAGRSLGRERTTTATFVVENDAPTAFAPVAAPAVGRTVSTGGGVSHGVAWRAATDPTSAITLYEIGQRTDNGAWVRLGSAPPTTRSILRTLTIGHRYAFRIRARDAAGNWSPWAEAPAFVVGQSSESSPAVRYAGTWYGYAYRYALGGRTKYSTRTGSTATLTFTGRSVALVAPKGPTRGVAQVYLDGKYLNTVNLYARTSRSRHVVFSRSFPTAGSHRLVIRVAGTRGHPRVEIDGFLISR